MKPQITRLSAWLALFVVSGYVVSPTFCRADATGISGPGKGNVGNTGTLRPTFPILGSVKSVRGQVERQEPLNNDFGPSILCKKGDKLPEGTIVETGHNSWADLAWNGTSSRIWQDSMIRILPCAKAVHLLNNGELVFIKTRNCPDKECIVETKRLQARIRGTTVSFKSLKDKDVVVVVETKDLTHKVEVYNKIDGSRTALAPGVILEIKGNKIDSSFIYKRKISEAEPPVPISDNALKLNTNRGELIFQGQNTTVAYTANAKAVLEDPMILGDDGANPIESIDLVREAMKKIPSSDNLIGNMIDTAFNANKPDKFICKNFKIVGVPKRDYFIGQNVGVDKSITLPSSVYDCDRLPSGVMTPVREVANVPRIAPVVARPVIMLHSNDNPAIDAIQEENQTPATIPMTPNVVSKSESDVRNN